MSPEELDALLKAPALEPPAGVTPDFDNPPNGNAYSWGITTVCMVIATVCLCLRWYVRIWLDRKVRVEDVMAICAYGAYWGTAYAAYAMIYSPGYYVHTWNLRNKDMIRPLYLILVYGCCYSAVLPMIKTAILLDWCRVFVSIDRTKNAFWWGCMTVACFQCVWGTLCVILLNMQCRPHRAIWEFYLPSKCYSLPDVMLCSASVQVISDVTMFCLPQKIIWGLQMSLKKRLGISLLFGVGILASIAACVRLSHTVAFANQADSIYLIGPLLFWADAEMTCGFFIFSVPCLSKLIMESGFRQKLFGPLGLTIATSNIRSRSNQGSDLTPSARGSRHAKKQKQKQKQKHWLSTTDTTWSRINEENVDLDDRSGTETGTDSQRNLCVVPKLHDPGPADSDGDGIQLQRSMDVAVSSDGHSGNTVVGDGVTPWR